ncbi:MAG: hypothetical protein O2944_05750 [Proteobacteria bacterium]|nr:hypothetical protein [Pseudomonadota bacterium]
MTKAIEIAHRDNRYVSAVQAFEPILNAIPPSPEMLWFAVTAARAYIALGDAEHFRPWLAMLRVSADLRGESRLALRRLLPLAWVLGVADTSQPLVEVIREWKIGAAEQPGLINALPLLNGMLLALGETVPAAAWEGVAVGKAGPALMPSAEIWFRFREKSEQLNASRGTNELPVSGFGGLVQPVSVAGLAAAGGGKAGVAAPIALAMTALGNASPGEMAPAVAFEVVKVLMAAGEIRTARQLAAETLLAAGF